MSKIKTIEKLGKNIITSFKKDYNSPKDSNRKYNYQKCLTEKLDEYEEPFTQETINEIVLWKINRYVKIDDEILILLNKIKDTDTEFNKELTREILTKLLKTKGVRIALASTILRFKNPNIYQIIDQRVYRFTHPNGEKFKHTEDAEKTISTYFDYLKRLKEICNEFEIPFAESDRILYLMDKEFNKDYKLK
ncbi:MAG: hypothetical protein GX259_09575 [Bacteroidales bacterium]|jgi:hypothetical protein|nr:hypothetical protein [Bacteroidales bacterium]